MRRITAQSPWDSFLIFAILTGLYFGIMGQLHADEFTDLLNIEREARGLSRVTFDPGSVPISERNNALQWLSGLGHHDTGGMGQCAIAGCNRTAYAVAKWIESPSHAAVILDPRLLWVGYACDGYFASVACSVSSLPVLASQTKSAASPVATFPPYGAAWRYRPRRGTFGRSR